MLSVDAERGQILKRHVRAAAALRDLFDDKGIASAVEVNRNAVAAWWAGAQMKPDTLHRLALATGLSFDELMAFVYRGGPPPSLPAADSPVASSVQEGLRRDRLSQHREGPDTPAQSTERPPHGSGAGRG